MMFDDETESASPPAALINTDAEQMVIAGVLCQPSLFRRLSFLRPSDFAYVGNARIWSEICAMSEEGIEITPVVLCHRLRDAGELEAAGGQRYVVELACVTGSSVNAEEYANFLRDLAMKRRFWLFAQEAKDSISGGNLTASEMVGSAISSLRSLMDEAPHTGRTKREVAESLVTDLGAPLPCYSTGIAGLDNILGGGLFSGKLYGLQARKKVGKSCLLGSISHNLNSAGHKHLFLTLEGGSAQIEQRNAARHGGFNAIRFLKRDDLLLAERVANYAVTIPNNVIYEDIPAAAFDQVRSLAAHHISTDGCVGVILDYWQLVAGKAAKETEEYHLRTVAQWMADTAVKEGIFFLAAAQENQTGNTRGGEGLKLACDAYLNLHREKDEKGAWVEMEECRYTMYQNLGSAIAPGLWMDPHGPHFRDIDA